MQYLCLIYEAESLYEKMDESQMGELMAQYDEFTQDIQTSGQLVAGDALMPSNTATCVQIIDGKVSTKSGPFEQTHEQLGGYYLVEAKSEEEAVLIASKIPAAKTGTIEIRPVMTFN
ncbi:hypothetical protein TYM08_P0302 [Marinicellulosiphila megalodicopiae]